MKIGFIKRKSGIFILAASVATILYVLLCKVYLHRPVSDSLLFICYISVFLLPGMVLVKLLKLQNTPLVSLVYSITLSFLMVFCLYLVFAFLNLMACLFLIPLIMLIFGAVGLTVLRSVPLYNGNDTGEFLIAAGLALVSLILTVFFLTASNLNPSLTGPRQYHPDLLNSAGLVVSAFRGFPFEDIKAAGIPYVYHAVPFSFLAVMKSVTGFTAFNLITDYSLSVFTPFSVLALAALVKRAANKSIYIISAFVILFVLSPFENRFIYYVYIDTLGFSLAAGFGAVSLLSFIDVSENQKKTVPAPFIVTLISLALMTAAKGPAAAVYLAGFGFALFISLFGRKNPLQIVIRGLLLLLTFIAVYFLIYSGDAASLVVWYPSRYIRDTVLLKTVESITGRSGAALGIAAFQFISFCFMTFSMIFMLSLLIIRFRQTDTFVCFTLFSALTGTVMTHLTHQYGGSEIYFILSAYSVSIAGLFCVIETIRKTDKRRNRIMQLIPLFILLSYCICISVAPAVRFFDNGYTEAVRYTKGSPAIIDDEYKLGAIDYMRYDFITDMEYDAMVWLKDNTSEDSVIVSDRVLLHNKFMYYSAFSERRFFLEGYVYITSYDENSPYSAEIARRIELLERLFSKDVSVLPVFRDYGCGYIAVSTWQNPNLRFEELEKVFENRDITIYRIG